MFRLPFNGLVFKSNLGNYILPLEMDTKASNIETIDYGLMNTKHSKLQIHEHTHRHKSIRHNILQSHNTKHNKLQTHERQKKI